MPRFRVSDCNVTSLRFGRYRRLVLLLAWLELLPTIGPFPVSSQRRDVGFSSCLLGLDAALLNTNGHRQRQRPEFIGGSLWSKRRGVKGFGWVLYMLCACPRCLWRCRG